ncbi:phosphatase PAP2 family protein [Zeaxanthinibacter enoshimensis]|uniref:PAP2 superfamily protein n=1 Tax=Zeaxanthinibacter enoshimensis TaxID=392009 RepID=A0A4R6TM80_9FLAO|nr:phosphatase PAP2 family protein [Zeaxanthinibacter enoshimensis]TDQ32534.1 PAP2 superfamily protein [Zeaxanthinibacter enoshimensis]
MKGIAKTSLLLLVSLFLSGAVLAQKDSTELQDTRWKMLTYDVGSVFRGIGFAYSRPLHWEKKQWLTLGGITAGTGLIYLVDDETSRFVSIQRESIPKFVRDYGELYGSPENNYLLTSGVYLAGLIAKDEKLRRTGVLLIASASAAGVLQQVAKSVVGRARPVSGLGKDTFDPFNSSRNFHSFPSGHTILAFTNAYAIAKQFKSPWVKAGFYAIGLVPGASRLWDQQHWLSDIAFGVALSIVTVESIDRYLDRRYDKKYTEEDKQLSWDLQFGPGNVGVVISF